MAEHRARRWVAVAIDGMHDVRDDCKVCTTYVDEGDEYIVDPCPAHQTPYYVEGMEKLQPFGDDGYYYTEEDARLIAAAPELLVAAKQALAWLVDAEPTSAETIDALISAIAKSRGLE